MSILRLLGILTLCGALTVVIGSCRQQAEPTKSELPQIWYLHLYSTRYDISVPVRDYSRDDEDPLDNECIATLSFTSGAPFYAKLPNHYEPEMHCEGLLIKRNSHFQGRIEIWFVGVDVAASDTITTAIPTELMQPLPVAGDEFHFAISKTADPYAIDTSLPLKTNAQTP